MITMMKRSFADAMGFQWPKELACIVNGRKVTWDEIRQMRRDRQARHLATVLRIDGPVRRAAFVWTFFVPGVIYGGWHLYLRTVTDSWWIRASNGIALEIMRTFPCGLLPIPENFYRWKQAFAGAFPRPGKFSRQGMLAGWIECYREGSAPLHFDSAYWSAPAQRRIA